MTEVDGQNVVREYEAPVSIIPEKGLYEYGYSNLQIKNHPHDIDLFDRVLEFANNNIQLIGETLYQRGLAWFYLGKYADAIIDIHQVVVLTKGRDTEVVEHQKMIAEKILAEKMYGIEVKNENFPIPGLVPYYFHINNLKKFPQKTIKDVIGIDEMNNIAAALAAFEEYELLERYIAEGNSLNVQCDAYFVDWQPTPFYYVTTWKVFDNLNDAEKILRFLVKNGADPDMSSGENSTALWNATHSGVPIEKLKLLIELGCDVNKKSADGEFLWTPLINCLRQTSDENDETIALPPDEITLEKAKFLIENGADINDRVSGLTPLMFAICNCDHKDLDFIKFLLENGANPNVIDDFSYTLTPLLLTHDYDWFEAGQLFLLYGAETETMQKLLEKRANRHIESLTLTVQNSFKPGSGEDSETSKNYDLSEIEQLTPINFEYFNVYLSEKTPTKLSGKVIFDCPETGVIKDCGEFTLSLENKEFYTESINFTYDIHTQLTLQIQLSDISLEDEFADEITAKEQARRDAEFTQKLSDFQENKEQYLSGISEELKGDFTDFCINTELGQFFVNINAAEHAILYWFLVFGEPFKNITFRNRYDDVLQAIYHLDYEKDPDFRSEWSGYWQLFESVYNNYRKMKTDTQHTDQEILDQYNKAENACRESMRYLGDVAFVSVAACRYLQGDMFNSYGMDEQGAECKKECQSTLYNLSQRDDLFSEEQMQVLEILRGVVGEVL
ncbi:ankyrin repeat domain-containing protein [Proteiniphilum sp.]|uniref:ankyrin repeat domain-containing protein n=1 Tax=Proteiniphilum sp. TaxID=1926877 RepID=UPI002B2009DA|nr:ankyrin repeat domain-containing protein [Proteiniphilum sp.]